jgi:hypothetical protein
MVGFAISFEDNIKMKQRTTKHFIAALYYYYAGNPIFNVHRAKAITSMQHYLTAINEQTTLHNRIKEWCPSAKFEVYDIIEGR